MEFDRELVRVWGMHRLLLIALSSVAFAVELGTPGHTLREAIAVLLYLGALVEGYSNALRRN